MFKLFVLIGALAHVCANVRMEPAVTQFTSSKWLLESKMDPSAVEVSMIFVLKKQNMDKFEAQLLQLSTPSSSGYGKWQTLSSIKQQIAPSASAVETVTNYVKSFGVSGDSVRLSALGDKLHVKVPVALASKMLDTEFALFRSVVQRNVVLARITKPYYLPDTVASVVSLVDDIMRFPSLRDAIQSYGAEDPNGQDAEFASCGSSCSGYTTPDVLMKAYSFTSDATVSSATSENSVAVAEFQLQYYDTADLKAFSSACDVTVEVDETIGGNVEVICEKGGCVEALLDIEYIGAIVNPIPLTVIYLSTFSILDWVDQVIAMASPPLVHSVSYGNDEVQQTSVEYMESVNSQFMVAGTMGLSILFASGDQGVWGRSGVGATYHPDFPAASPYVTAVGGTNFATKGVIGEESAWSCGGGGFSDTFPMPVWQQSAVSGYLALAAQQGVLPSASLFNATGRAYPDVSALGGQTNPYCIAVKGGSFSGVAGTSASCPVVAGLFAKLNSVRLAAGKASLGWLNPFIYSTGSACFNDVNDGSSNFCNKGTTGFAALNGWDPATGFGTPNYQCLAALM